MVSGVKSEIIYKTTIERNSLCTIWLAPGLGLLQLEVDGDIIGSLIEYNITANQTPIASSTHFLEKPEIKTRGLPLMHQVLMTRMKKLFPLR